MSWNLATTNCTLRGLMIFMFLTEQLYIIMISKSQPPTQASPSFIMLHAKKREGLVDFHDVIDVV